MKKLLALGCLSVLLSQSTFAATIIADWTFETTSNKITGTTNVLVGLSADVGSGSAVGVHSSGPTTWSHPAGNGSPSSFSVNNWSAGDFYQFQSSTIGFSGIFVQYDQTGSATGPRDFTFSYSTDGDLTPIGGHFIRRVLPLV